MAVIKVKVPFLAFHFHRASNTSGNPKKCQYSSKLEHQEPEKGAHAVQGLLGGILNASKSLMTRSPDQRNNSKGHCLKDVTVNLRKKL